MITVMEVYKNPRVSGDFSQRGDALLVAVAAAEAAVFARSLRAGFTQ